MKKQYVVSVVFNNGYFETYAHVKRVKISKTDLEIIQKRYTVKIALEKVNYYVAHFPGGYCLKLSVRGYEVEFLTVHKKAITEERGFLTCHENG